MRLKNSDLGELDIYVDFHKFSIFQHNYTDKERWYFLSNSYDLLDRKSRPNQSQCVGLQASQLRGRAARKFLLLCFNCPLATTASPHCASIVLLLCARFCAHIARSRSSQAGAAIHTGGCYW